MTTAPLQFLLMVFAGWVNRRQLAVIDYLKEENRFLREQLGGRRLRSTDDQRRRLATKGKVPGPRRAGRARRARDSRDDLALVPSRSTIITIQGLAPRSTIMTSRLCSIIKGDGGEVRLLASMPLDSSECRWLSRQRDYIVLSIERSGESMKFRIASEMNGTPVLFDSAIFEVVDEAQPGTWIATPTEAGIERSPEPWTVTGFWERFFDGEPDAVQIFKEESEKLGLTL
jgi:hypothetical protein